MKSHVSKAVSNCFAALRRLRSIRRLVSQPVPLLLITSLIMTRLDYRSETLAGLPVHLLDRLQSVLYAAARLVCYALSTTTLHISSGISTGCGFWKEYNFDWPYSISAAVRTWRLHTSSAIFNGLTKQSRCDDYGPSQQRLILPRTRLRPIGDRSFRVTAARA